MEADKELEWMVSPYSSKLARIPHFSSTPRLYHVSDLTRNSGRKHDWLHIHGPMYKRSYLSLAHRRFMHSLSRWASAATLTHAGTRAPRAAPQPPLLKLLSSSTRRSLWQRPCGVAHLRACWPSYDAQRATSSAATVSAKWRAGPRCPRAAAARGTGRTGARVMQPQRA